MSGNSSAKASPVVDRESRGLCSVPVHGSIMSRGQGGGGGSRIRYEETDSGGGEARSSTLDPKR
jgi:hypothetical protein